MKNEKRSDKAAIEAILFAAGYPVNFSKLTEILAIDEENVKKLVQELQKDYSSKSHGIAVIVYENTCQFCTKEEQIDNIRAALGVRRGGNLSRTSMETLAIVAYHQPVTKSYVEQIRGIDSSYAVNNLCEKKLIEICGKLDAPGKPALYRTTDNFLRVFGIKSLSELPPVELFGEPEIDASSENKKNDSEV